MTEDEIDEKLLALQAEYDTGEKTPPTTLAEVKYQQKKLANLKLSIINIIDDCLCELEVDDFLANGAGYKQIK